MLLLFSFFLFLNTPAPQSLFFCSVNAATGQRWCRQGQRVLWLPADPTNPLRLQSASVAFLTKNGAKRGHTACFFFFLCLTCSMKQHLEPIARGLQKNGIPGWEENVSLFFIVLKMHFNITGPFLPQEFSVAQLRIIWCYKDEQSECICCWLAKFSTFANT